MKARRLSWRFRGDASGATAVEFSIIVIPLLLSLLGSVEFGRMLWTRQSMSEVAIMASRCIGLPQTECSASGVRDAAKTRTFALSLASNWKLPLTDANVAIDTAATCGGAAGFSKITITYKFATAVPQLIKQLADNPMTVSSCFPNSTST
ncbi:TadE/TadG family type IV pilus assembly protein [Methylopila sp. M107]|uniref:TadE/TadG family type IV pilus assembly protein n=1 Tax=Methylopila sp. M107 TaxID=1101190 RepID=UPI0003607932|nr:TadE/TadG family type IV pilus assembly protein [Methylopila sp. M107]